MQKRAGRNNRSAFKNFTGNALKLSTNRKHPDLNRIFELLLLAQITL